MCVCVFVLLDVLYFFAFARFLSRLIIGRKDYIERETLAFNCSLSIFLLLLQLETQIRIVKLC